MKKKNALSTKLLFVYLGALVTIVMAVTLVGAVLLIPLDKDAAIKLMYISQVIIAVLLVMAFIYIMDKMIIRRIDTLNSAMSEVARGNYEITVPVEKKDELSELTDSFNKMTTELKTNAFLSKDFTRYVSHEFKTPLAVIRSHAEAAEYSETKEEMQEYLSVIISETDRLAEISKNILELCRLDSTTIISKNDTFSPATQIRNILLSTQFGWIAKNISIEPELEEFEIKNNETLVFRIWQNLIGNAIKFTEENGAIHISLQREENSFIFSISDNGIGISDEDKEKIFNPFFTGDKSHNKDGSGLGLPLVKSIVDKLNGEISCTSKLNKGTKFIVRLPL